MMKPIALLALLSMACLALFAQSYDQPWRNQTMFSPPQNFMNDPNGLVFYKGEYHLFYQYNPEGNVWGHMSWGHAVSGDMVHWKNLPVALPEKDRYMIYSGSVVVDWQNTSGLCWSSDAKDPSCMIAIFTAAGKDRQAQHLAVSNDHGRSWREYLGNPVADLKAPDFRDPKVFWYEPAKKWVMVAALADERIIKILDSPDLKSWKVRSSFGPAGTTEGQFECPDLLQLPVEGTNEKKWVLIVNRNPTAPAGGTGTRYFIGTFDGTKFNDETGSRELWADYGKDFYATNSFANLPGGHAVWMGWIGNWQYANVEPTSPWRGQQSFPRMLTLKKFSDGLRLVQTPIEQMESLRGPLFHLSGQNIVDANLQIDRNHIGGDLYEMEVVLNAAEATRIGMRLRKSAKEETLVGYTPASGEIFVDRTKSGETSFSKDFPARSVATVTKGAKVKLHIFVDRSCIQIFVNDGEATLTNLVYPSPQSTAIEFYSSGSEGVVESLSFWPLSSIWQPDSKAVAAPKQ